MTKLFPLAAALIAAGCATPPGRIDAASIPASNYAGRDCAQLAAEYAAADTSLQSLTAAQSDAYTTDVVGVMLVGLPLGNMTDGDTKQRTADIARLKGEKTAIHEAQRAGGCFS